MANTNFNPITLLNKRFSEESPMQVNMDQSQEIRQTLVQELAGMRHVIVEQPYGRDAEGRVICSLYIDFPNPRTYHRFALRTNEEGFVTILYPGKREKRVSSWKEVVALADDCQEIAEIRYAAANKRSKVRDLKEKTIVAQIKKLAQEENFTFCFTTNTRKVKVYIRLDSVENLMVSIPYNKFQETVPLLRNAVLTMREMHQQGIRFGLSQTSPVGRYSKEQWITPE